MKYENCNEFLVTKILAQKPHYIRALYYYYIAKMSPSEIDQILKVYNTRSIRLHTLQHCSESEFTVEKFNKAFSLIKAVENAYEHFYGQLALLNPGYLCPFCRKQIHETFKREDHLLKRHKEEIKKLSRLLR